MKKPVLADQGPDPLKIQYPKNKDGLADEWIAIERQKQKAIEALEQQEKDAIFKEKRAYLYNHFFAWVSETNRKTDRSWMK